MKLISLSKMKMENLAKGGVFSFKLWGHSARPRCKALCLWQTVRMRKTLRQEQNRPRFYFLFFCAKESNSPRFLIVQP
ncbi:hypothetical protein O6P43_028796 [Quillaja saponaria]|uniref:Uncharacterized protein n=1 Tax=Quillaja saponaria TaxID=32244 RepID=A0AAD7PAH4_QUISA|nr:hypothetical protein O6P43_028796 [Quillaja saponaria]